MESANVALPDTLDLDPDLERTADEEPWLGAPDARAGSSFGPGADRHGDDREDDGDDLETDCDDEDGNDAEWELGWTAVQAQTGNYLDVLPP